MKKLLLVAVIGIAFFASCEKMDSTSLTGTLWSGKIVGQKAEWPRWEIAFSSSYATIVKTDFDGVQDVFTGRYTFDPPYLMITGHFWTKDGVLWEERYSLEHTGTVNLKRRTMEMWIQDTPDSFVNTTLTKR